MEQRKIISIIVIGMTLFFTVFISSSVQAMSKSDARIRTFVYNENEIYNVNTEYGYQSNIEFAKKEHILTLSVGDSVGFKITPSGNRLFIRALQNGSHTNMTILTNLHAYQFELSSNSDDNKGKEIVYVTRFFYPEVVGDEEDYVPVERGFFSDDTKIESEDINYNFNYSITGPDYFAPTKIFDDGEATFFKFPEKENVIPAFSFVGSDGKEYPLSVSRDGEYIVLERVVGKLALRYESDVICVFNDNVTTQDVYSVNK